MIVVCTKCGSDQIQQAWASDHRTMTMDEYVNGQHTAYVPTVLKTRELTLRCLACGYWRSVDVAHNETPVFAPIVGQPEPKAEATPHDSIGLRATTRLTRDVGPESTVLFLETDCAWAWDLACIGEKEWVWVIDLLENRRQIAVKRGVPDPGTIVDTEPVAHLAGTEVTFWYTVPVGS